MGTPPTDWPAVVRDHGPRVWRTARRLLGNDADAADCYQRTFLAAAELDSRDPVRSWPAALVRLATARALEQLRSRYRKSGRAAELPEGLASAGPEACDLASSSELASALRLALAGLDPLQAQAFCLVCLEGESNVGAAGALGLSANHVGVLLHRAKAALRLRLAAFDPAKEVRPWTDPDDLLDRAARALAESAPPGAGAPPGLGEATLAAIEARLARPAPVEVAKPVPSWPTGRKQMVRTLLGGAALVAVVVGLVVAPESNAASAFEKAADNAAHAKAVQMRTETTIDGPTKTVTKSKMWIQGDRARNETDAPADQAVVAIVDAKLGKSLALIPATKMAMWVPVDPDAAKKVGMPTDLAGQFAALKGKNITALPDETDAGRTLKVFAVSGVELGGAPAAMTILIDPKTNFPARIRTEFTLNGLKVASVADYSAWDEPIDDKLFDLAVPDGYTVVEMPKLPALPELKP